MLSPTDADLAKRDGVLRGLATLLDRDAFADALRVARDDATLESAELTYLRYKPGTNCIAAYRVRAAGRTRTVYAKAHASDAEIKLHKARSLPWDRSAQGRARTFLDDLGIVVFEFPDDANVRVLSRLADPLRRRHLLARVFRERAEVPDGPILTLAYKPERRYVAHLRPSEGEGAVLRFYALGDYQAAAGSSRALESRGALRLARKCGGSKRHRILALEWIPGRTLQELIRDPDRCPGDLARVGQALAELHAQRSERLMARNPGTELAKLRALAATLGFLCPSIAERASALAARIASRLSASAAGRQAIHGDLYDRQVLVDGDRVALVDLDRAAIGDPRSDLGLFIAHLERDRQLEKLSAGRIDQITGSLLEAYQQATASRVEGLGAYVADGLFRLAHDPFRSHQPGWPDRTQRILARAEEILAGSP